MIVFVLSYRHLVSIQSNRFATSNRRIAIHIVSSSRIELIVAIRQKMEATDAAIICSSPYSVVPTNQLLAGSIDHTTPGYIISHNSAPDCSMLLLLEDVDEADAVYIPRRVFLTLGGGPNGRMIVFALDFRSDGGGRVDRDTSCS